MRSVRRNWASGHQVVDDPAFFVEQHRILLTSRLEPDEVAGNHILKGGQGGHAAQARLAHVGDVEDPAVFAGPQMFLHYAVGILDGHGIAGEFDHARAQCDVRGVERCDLERRIGQAVGSG